MPAAGQPGARLLIGKVFDRGGTQESFLISAMQWATGQGARVVNMSLGGEDSPGTDPVEKAVNDLSASSGALFVIAAGNSGPDAGTVNSPGAAASALTVAAVDGDDRLTSFSSRGPTADGDLEPDIAAPGWNIIAAKAAHGTEGDAVSTAGYVRMSGTSMATPHVAGAAAILAQQHPDWTGRRIKAALRDSAVALKDASTPYDAGAGRVDVATALAQTVVADDPSLDFGLQKWPHTDDRPVTRTLTYTNTGDQPVTLDLAATGTGPDGRAAPTGLFTLAADRLTVPAGGTARTTVTADTRTGTADGTYSGSVTATSASGTDIHTVLGVVREVESYDLSVVRFMPRLSLTSTAKAGSRLAVPIGLQGPAAQQGAVRSLTVQVSYDGGRTWKPAPCTPPPTAGAPSSSPTRPSPARSASGRPSWTPAATR
ncbi:S8 family serine peptidase [Streptomyces sp. NPDC101234]|uniref:S8 family serine peptidase n=1 Tax=Streptomyces sp. NPDC101234 TaxID=3366138 RepID=UPI0037F49B35